MSACLRASARHIAIMGSSTAWNKRRRAVPPSKVCVESSPVQAESEEVMPGDPSASVLIAMAMVS